MYLTGAESCSSIWLCTTTCRYVCIRT